MRLYSWLRDLRFSRRPHRTARRRRGLHFPESAWVEILEQRTLLSGFQVTTAADVFNGSDGVLSLREAILASNATSGSDVISFASAVQGTIALTGGSLGVTGDLTIDGPGAGKLAVSGNGLSGVFVIDAGANVAISDLSIVGGLAAQGAGIFNSGNLSLSQVVLSGNVAQSAVGGGNAFGGAIYNDAGSVSIGHSVLSNNQAVAGDGGTGGTPITLPGGLSASLLGVAGGGAIWNDGGSVAIEHSVLDNNLSQGGSGGDARTSSAVSPWVGTSIGGAIGNGALFQVGNPSLAVDHSELRDNRALGGTNVVSASFASDFGSGRGGAVGAIAGDISLTHSTIDSNLARGGSLFTLDGGAITIRRGAVGSGGGIFQQYNLGISAPLQLMTLDIAHSVIHGNTAQGIGPSASGFGGGLAARYAAIQMTDSTLSDNQALGGLGGGEQTFFGFTFFNPGGSGTGGGIDSGNGSLTITHSNVNDNLALGGEGNPALGNLFAGSGGSSFGGGIVLTNHALTLTNSTLSGNQAVGGNASANGFQGGSGGAGALVLQGSGNSATISGSLFLGNRTQGGTGAFSSGGSVEGAVVSRFTTLQITDSTFRENESVGGAGGNGTAPGGAGSEGGRVFSGALHVSEGTVATIRDTSFVRNLSQGGAGGAGNPGAPGGAGGAAEGGAMSNVLAVTTLENTTFDGNDVRGGAGGAGGAGANGGAGGRARGGAIWNVLAFGSPSVTSLTVSGGRISSNQAVGGAGGAAFAGGIGGVGGNADGAGIFSSRTGIAGLVSLTIVNSSIQFNEALGGAASSGGTGGNARGGGILVDDATTATVDNSDVYHNLARGGDGTVGGDGRGGGLYIANAATVTVTRSKIKHNRAIGGEGQGGPDGVGIGGGAFVLGIFFVDGDTRIDHNEASTSDDDVFGPIFPI